MPRGWQLSAHGKCLAGPDDGPDIVKGLLRKAHCARAQMGDATLRECASVEGEREKNILFVLLVLCS